MSILQVTPEGMQEHWAQVSTEPHYRLNTLAAIREVAAMTRRERDDYYALGIIKDGDMPDPRQQEAYLIKRWSIADNLDAKIDHKVSRALQSARFFVVSGSQTPEAKGTIHRMDIPLVETPQRRDSEFHWRSEALIRYGVSRMLEIALDEPVPELLPIERGKAVPDDRRHYQHVVGGFVLNNTVAVSYADALGVHSSYTLQTV